jgi:hypothetical protein
MLYSLDKGIEKGEVYYEGNLSGSKNPYLL